MSKKAAKPAAGKGAATPAPAVAAPDDAEVKRLQQLYEERREKERLAAAEDANVRLRGELADDRDRLEKQIQKQRDIIWCVRALPPTWRLQPAAADQLAARACASGASGRYLNREIKVKDEQATAMQEQIKALQTAAQEQAAAFEARLRDTRHSGDEALEQLRQRMGVLQADYDRIQTFLTEKVRSPLTLYYGA